MTRHRMRLAPLCAVLLAAAVVTTGCDTVSDVTDSINPFSKRETVLPGERRPVFEGTDPAAVAAGRPASPGAASGGRIWTQAGGNAANNPGNVAISVSGARAWSASLGSTGGGGIGSLTSSPIRTSARPVSDGSRIFVYKQNGEVVALSAGNGGRLWVRNLRPEGERDVGAGGGVAVDGGRVFAATAYGTVAALDAGSGQVLWSQQIQAPAREAPTASGGNVYVVTQNNEVVALSQADGTEKWTYSGIPETGGVLSSANPAVSGNVVVLPFSSGEVMAIDTAKGEARWADGLAQPFRTLSLSGLVDVSGSPVIADGVVYAAGVGGRVIAAKLSNGERIWEQQFGSVHTPVVSGNALFMIDLDDRMVALDRKTGTPLWHVELPNVENRKKRINWAGPLLANGTLIAVSSDGQMARVDATTGRIVETKKISVNVFVNPIAAGGRMVVITSRGDVVAFN